jgi:hypothetical protein
MIVSASTAIPFATSGSSPFVAQAKARATASPQVVEAEIVPVSAESEGGPEIVVRMREKQAEAAPRRIATYGPDGRGRPSFDNTSGQVLRITA